MADNQEPLIPEKTKTKPVNKKQTKIAEYPKNFTGRVEKVIDTLELPDQANRELLKLRFLDEVEFYEKKRNKTKYYYNIFRFVVTTGSILLPAILSIGQMDPTKLPKNFEQITYWSAWSISLMVTISNGFLQLFSLDKNYFNYSLTVEQLKTEGWQFFGLSGKYEDYMKHDLESYKNFCKNIETIKRKQIENEFNGKADSKKKSFDFAGEFKKFQENTINAQKDLVKEVGKASTDAVNKTVNAAKEEVLPFRDIETGLEKANQVEKKAGEYLKNAERENIVEVLNTNDNDNNEKM